MPTTAVYVKKPKDSYYLARKGTRCRAGIKRQAIVCDPAPPSATPGGRELVENLRVPLLEREVSELRVMVRALYDLIDKDSLAAAQRLAKITPSNATLKLWVERSNTYPDLAAGIEERPW